MKTDSHDKTFGLPLLFQVRVKVGVKVKFRSFFFLLAGKILSKLQNGEEVKRQPPYLH